MKKINLFPIAILAAAFAISCSNQTETRPEVKNVIYLIGDGMGLGAVSSLVLSEDNPTGFEQAPVIGLSETPLPEVLHWLTVHVPITAISEWILKASS